MLAEKEVTMYLITIQHENVLKELRSKGQYHCNYLGGFSKQYPVSYGELATMLWVDIPIFAWKQVYKDKSLHVNQLSRMLEMTPLPKGSVILELEVPNDIPLLTNFYEWVGRLEEESGDIEVAEDRVQIWSGILDVSTCYEIQAVLPYIKEDWIIGSHLVSDLADESN